MNLQDLHNIEGLQFIPVNEKKQPLVKNWQTSRDKHNLSNVVSVGLVCGEPSGNVECIDVDMKYALDKDTFDKYKKLIHSVNDKLLNKLVVQKTKSGGYHIIYRCKTISGNIKLANRKTTEQEKEETYKKTYEAEVLKGTEDGKAKSIAEKSAASDKVRVLFETRGIGGQFVVHPSQGYEFIFGDLFSISEITPEERDTLHGIARQFNEVFEEYSPQTKALTKTKGISIFDDYNNRGDVVSILENHGWRIVDRKGNKTVFLRPGQTTSSSSGNFDHEKKWFSVFTTSTEFEPCRAYLPYAVYAVLECDKNFSEAAKRLYDLGYGERIEEKKEKGKEQSTRIIQSRIDPESKDKSLFATSDDYEQHLHQVRTGTLAMGLTTGCPLFDEYFLFKKGNLVMTNGLDNTGKSEFMWWLELIAAMFHGWKGIIFSSENTLGSFMRRMIQFYWGKPLAGQYAVSQKEFEIAKMFIEKHFLLIRAQEVLYNYKDIINLIKIALSDSEYHYGMIDPYNSLKTDLSGFSKLSTHEYHYEALSEIKAFGQKNNFGWIINNHAVTSALRLKDSEKKYPVAPRKEDTEGGGKFANKADDFLTIHRITQHPTEWMVTEVHVRKIKDTETGGRPTPLDEPIKFERYKGGYAYCERYNDGTRGEDPIDNWHMKRKPKQKELIQQTGFLPYKDDNGSEIEF